MQKVIDQKVVDQVERERWKRILQTLKKDWRLYILLIPMLIFLILFKYKPILGIFGGFKWETGTAIRADQWAGFKWGFELLGNYGDRFWRAFRNTFVNSMYGLICGFPIPIFLALLFSEIKNDKYITYTGNFEYDRGPYRQLASYIHLTDEKNKTIKVYGFRLTEGRKYTGTIIYSEYSKCVVNFKISSVTE